MKMEASPMPIGYCSKEQKKIYRDWFNIADSDGDGRVSGNNVRKFFAISQLSRQELKQVQREFHPLADDFPSVEHYREVLNNYSIDKFEKFKPEMIQDVDDMLGYELLKNFRNPYE